MSSLCHEATQCYQRLSIENISIGCYKTKIKVIVTTQLPLQLVQYQKEPKQTQTEDIQTVSL